MLLLGSQHFSVLVWQGRESVRFGDLDLNTNAQERCDSLNDWLVRIQILPLSDLEEPICESADHRIICHNGQLWRLETFGLFKHLVSFTFSLELVEDLVFFISGTFDIYSNSKCLDPICQVEHLLRVIQIHANPVISVREVSGDVWEYATE